MTTTQSIGYADTETWYSQELLYRGAVYHDITCGTAITVAESELDSF